jgi:polysaccharide export outer membrane protein
MVRTLRRLYVAIAVVALVLGLAVSGADAQDGKTPRSGERPAYTLGSGDQLKLTIFGHEDLSGEYEVDGNGTISLPLVGDVEVGDKTVNAAERAIETAYKPDYLVNPRVSIQVLNYRPFYILGEVEKPGSYAYVNGLTVVEAVSIAGGYTYRADKDDVKIVRKTEPKKEVIDVDEDTRVLPGDTIRVPERFF